MDENDISSNADAAGSWEIERFRHPGADSGRGRANWNGDIHQSADLVGEVEKGKKPVLLLRILRASGK